MYMYMYLIIDHNSVLKKQEKKEKNKSSEQNKQENRKKNTLTCTCIHMLIMLNPPTCIHMYVYIKEVSSFQRVKCVVFINLEPCRCVLIREVSAYTLDVHVHVHVVYTQKYM